MALRPGNCINDRYQILSLQGSGGFADVYRALDLELKREVAIKVLHLQRGQEHDLARFLREARTLAAIEHKNIVSVFAVDSLNDSTPFIVMELLEGRSLRKLLLEKGSLDKLTLSSLLSQVCSGLSCAHQAGIVHRDLSPENIFLTEKGNKIEFKLLDFGLSFIQDTELERLTKTGVIVGNPSYMSPEMSQGQRTDLRSDIYSLGCILYECLSGKRPFDADSALTLLLLQKSAYPPELRLSWGDPLSEELFKYITLRCLQKDPAMRFQSCSELLELLESGNLSTAAVKSIVSWSNTSKKKSSKTKLLAMLCIPLLSLAAIGFTLALRNQQEKQSKKEIQIDRSLASPERKLWQMYKYYEKHSDGSFNRAEMDKQLRVMDKMLEYCKGKKNTAWSVLTLKGHFLHLLAMQEAAENSKAALDREAAVQYKKALDCCLLEDGRYCAEAYETLFELARKAYYAGELEISTKYIVQLLELAKAIQTEKAYPHLKVILAGELLPPLAEIKGDANEILSEMALQRNDITAAKNCLQEMKIAYSKNRNLWDKLAFLEAKICKLEGKTNEANQAVEQFLADAAGEGRLLSDDFSVSMTKRTSTVGSVKVQRDELGYCSALLRAAAWYDASGNPKRARELYLRAKPIAEAESHQGFLNSVQQGLSRTQ